MDLFVAPLKRIAAQNTPAPFSPPMEKFYVPDAVRIAQAARDLMAIS